MVSSGKGPLAGLRVVDLSEFVAVPVAAKMLADWGAEVVKVERFEGDVWRWYGPSFNVPCQDDENPLFDMENLNKKLVALNLKTDKGRSIMQRLLSEADIFMTNYRIDALKRMGLSYEDLSVLYPKLIFVHLTGFGEKGPDAGRPGFDIVAYWARSGAMLDLVPAEHGVPISAPFGFGDHITGEALVGGILAALYQREKTGRGDKVFMSLFGNAIFGAGCMIMSSQDKYGDPLPRYMTKPGNPVGHTYQCKDGEWILLSILAYDRYWPIFCEKVLGRPDLLQDERFRTKFSAKEYSAELYKILHNEIKKKSSDEWASLLRAADIAFEKVAHFKDVTKDEQALANEYIFEHTFKNGNKAMLPRTPVQFGSYKIPNPPPRAGTRVGEHTADVLLKMGYTDFEIEDLEKQGIIKNPSSK
ncbi:MAG: CoA transferase [Syntrophobacterales bacterium]|nr:MAG: CoA transferase [Syntrophobacterales bacterium]